MQHFLSFEQIAQRVEAMGLRPARFCELAGIDNATFWRYGRGKQTPLVSSLERLSQALCAEERRLLEHLIELHPQHAASLLAGNPEQGEASPFAMASGDRA